MLLHGSVYTFSGLSQLMAPRLLLLFWLCQQQKDEEIFFTQLDVKMSWGCNVSMKQHMVQCTLQCSIVAYSVALYTTIYSAYYSVQCSVHYSVHYSVQ